MIMGQPGNNVQMRSQSQDKSKTQFKAGGLVQRASNMAAQDDSNLPQQPGM
jgi:hypothetical protein